jgi:hypothetical protein
MKRGLVPRDAAILETKQAREFLQPERRAFGPRI